VSHMIGEGKKTMLYDYIAIPDSEVPKAVEPTFQHILQVQTWLRLAGQHVPAIYGPSGDVKWAEADPTYSVEAAKRGG
jgi:hypothetical protein